MLLFLAVVFGVCISRISAMTEKEFTIEYTNLVATARMINDQIIFPDRYIVVKSSEGKILLLTFFDDGLQEIPDVETMHEFGYASFENLTLLHEGLESRFKKKEPLMSLKYTEFPQMSPDDMVRNKIQRIMAIQPPSFITSYIFLKSVINPSIISYNNRTLISWKTGWGADIYGDCHSDLRFGFLPNDFKSRATMTSQDFVKVTIDENSLQTFTNFPCKEDPRLLFLHDNKTLAVFYATFVGGNRRRGSFKQNVLFGTVNEDTNTVDVTENYMYDIAGQNSNQKNWIPFIHEQRLILIQNLRPYQVVEPTGNVNTNNNIRPVKFISNSEGEEQHIPWKGEYGYPPRGGTPAILVNGIYMSLFHSMSMFQGRYDLRTYFMGAMTFCTHFPYALHSMSMYPIANHTAFYDGAWTTNKVDYVIFPTGVQIDPEDTDYIWVSAGWQDKDSYLLRMNIAGLLSTLEIVNVCNTTLTHHNHKFWTHHRQHLLKEHLEHIHSSRI